MSIDNTLLTITPKAFAALQLLEDNLKGIADSSTPKPNHICTKVGEVNQYMLAIIVRHDQIDERRVAAVARRIMAALQGVEEDVFMPRSLENAAQFNWRPKSGVWEGEPDEQPGQAQNLVMIDMFDMQTSYNRASVHQVTHELCSVQLTQRLQKYKLPATRVQWFLYQKE